MNKISVKLLLLILIMPPLFFFCGSDGYDKNVKPNILLITIDTLRRDHLGAYGYYRETSPFIDSLAKDGLKFNHAVTPIPLTAGSHATILTSLHPLTHDVIMNGTRLNEKVQTIAEVLKTDGYYTIGAVSVGLLTESKNFSQGFDAYSDVREKDPALDPKFPLFERTASAVNKSLFALIDGYKKNPESTNKPLFIWVHYFDPHGPYYEWDDTPFKVKLKKGIPKGVEKYDKEIRFTDRHIKQLYSLLQEKGLTEQLVTCITADHGEQFKEHGYCYGHADFYSENTFVPLILHGYGIPRNQVVDKYMSTLDIAVTLVGMAGKTFDYHVHGIDLFTRNNRKPRLYEYPDRKFLILGNPMYARSLQILGNPYSYILNFDYHYKYWYISGKSKVCKDNISFNTLSEKYIRYKGRNIIISLPQTKEKGRKYTVVSADIEENKGLRLRVKVLPFLFTKMQRVSGKIKHLNIIYPVTVMDRLIITLKPAEGTVVKNFKVAVVPEKELIPETLSNNKIENKIFNDLLTLRKKKKQDELFDLSSDFVMEKNLIEVKSFKPLIVRSKKLIYAAFKFFKQQKNILLKGNTEEKHLSAEDKKMLKSLGYL